MEFFTASTTRLALLYLLNLLTALNLVWIITGRIKRLFIILNLISREPEAKARLVVSYNSYYNAYSIGISETVIQPVACDCFLGLWSKRQHVKTATGQTATPKQRQKWL